MDQHYRLHFACLLVVFVPEVSDFSTAHYFCAFTVYSSAQNIKYLMCSTIRFLDQLGQTASFHCTDPRGREGFVPCFEDKEGHAKVWLDIS
jgi:hypothetical protein